jgi:hypothetical protein
VKLRGVLHGDIQLYNDAESKSGNKERFKHQVISQGIGSYYAPDNRRALPHSITCIRWRQIPPSAFEIAGQQMPTHAQMVGLTLSEAVPSYPNIVLQEKPSTSAASFQTS